MGIVVEVLGLKCRMVVQEKEEYGCRAMILNVCVFSIYACGGSDTMASVCPGPFVVRV